MRLFAAIQPSHGFRAALEDLQQRLREAGVTGKYREPDGLHLTLAFIGEWPEDITELLPVVQKPFSVTLSHLGIFPEANVLWAGVEPCEELDLLTKQVRHCLADAGIPFDRKSFSPHITLIRKASGNWKQVTAPKGQMMVKKISLMKTTFRDGKPVYSEVASF